MTAVFCFGAVLVNQNVERSEFVTDPEMKPVLAADAEPGQKTVTVMIGQRAFLQLHQQSEQYGSGRTV